MEAAESIKVSGQETSSMRHILVIGNSSKVSNFDKFLSAKYRNEFVICNDLVSKNPVDYKSTDLLKELETMLKESVVDEVLIIYEEDQDDISPIISYAKMAGRATTILFPNKQHDYHSNSIQRSMGNRSESQESLVNQPFYNALKRVFDFVFSGLLIAFISPLLALIALAIKIESPDGPVFFAQERVGLNGRRFKVLKFRTMVANAEKLKDKLRHLNEMDGPVFKITNDPRITKVGHLLRKTSLDELPQFINVLKGEMSVVGPRPLPTKEAISCDLQHQIRHAVKPGITCIWQISGRNDVTYEEWKQMDLDYIQKRNLILDLQLVFKTVFAVVGMTGK